MATSDPPTGPDGATPPGGLDPGAGPVPPGPGRAPYRALVVLLCLGVVVPLVTVVLKLAAEDFRLWHLALERVEGLRSWIDRVPALDLERFPVLSRVAWHHPWGEAFLRVYVRYAAANTVLLVVVLVFRRRLMTWLGGLRAWAAAPDHRRERRLIVTVGAVLMVTWVLRAPLGFWFPGIGGWTYEGFESRIRTDPPTAADGFRPPSSEERAVLRGTLRPDNARHLTRSGYLEGPAMTLRFADGSELPGSLGLTDLVFPQYQFGTGPPAATPSEAIGPVLKNALRTRVRGRRFLIPGRLGYANHTPYAWIDYRGYPPPETLVGVTYWRVVIRAGPDEPVELVAVRQDSRVDF